MAMEHGTADLPEGMPQAQAMQFRCTNCAAAVVWDPGADALKCDNCGHTQKVEDSAKPVVEYDFREGMAKVQTMGAQHLTQGGHEVKCDECGAQTVLVQDSGRCPFCDSPKVINHASTEAVIVPESLLPHKVTRDDSKALFGKWVKSRWFAPGDLSKRAKLAGMDGVYLPYWTYDSETYTQYQGMRGEYYWVTVTYRDSQGNTRTRSERRTRWYPASGTVHVSFDDVLVCASKSLPRKLVEELEPWDMEALTPFHPGYVSGFVAERYQIGLEEGFHRAEERMDPVIRKAIRADIGGDVQRIISTHTMHQHVTFKHLLLPVWISAFKYNKKTFRIMVNARTGEVQGERPWSAFKIIALILVCLGAIGGAIYALSKGSEQDSGGGGTPQPGVVEPVVASPPPIDDTGTGTGTGTDTDAGSDGGAALIEKHGGAAAFDVGGFLPDGLEMAKVAAADSALTAIEIEGLGPGGKVALGRVQLRYRSLITSKEATMCRQTISVREHSAQAYDDSTLRKRQDCEAALLEGPHCTLAEVRARAEALKAPADGVAEVVLRARSSKTPDVATRGEWSYESGRFKKKFADDCGVAPEPEAVAPKAKTKVKKKKTR